MSLRLKVPHNVHCNSGLLLICLAHLVKMCIWGSIVFEYETGQSPWRRAALRELRRLGCHFPQFSWKPKIVARVQAQIPKGIKVPVSVIPKREPCCRTPENNWALTKDNALNQKGQNLSRSHVKSESSKHKKSGAWNPRGDAPNRKQVATHRRDEHEGLSVGTSLHSTTCHLSGFASFGPHFWHQICQL